MVRRKQNNYKLITNILIWVVVPIIILAGIGVGIAAAVGAFNNTTKPPISISIPPVRSPTPFPTLSPTLSPTASPTSAPISNSAPITPTAAPVPNPEACAVFKSEVGNSNIINVSWPQYVSNTDYFVFDISFFTINPENFMNHTLINALGDENNKNGFIIYTQDGFFNIDYYYNNSLTLNVKNDVKISEFLYKYRIVTLFTLDQFGITIQLKVNGYVNKKYISSTKVYVRDFPPIITKSGSEITFNPSCRFNSEEDANFENTLENYEYLYNGNCEPYQSIESYDTVEECVEHCTNDNTCTHIVLDNQCRLYRGCLERKTSPPYSNTNPIFINENVIFGGTTKHPFEFQNGTYGIITSPDVPEDDENFVVLAGTYTLSEANNLIQYYDVQGLYSNYGQSNVNDGKVMMMFDLNNDIDLSNYGFRQYNSFNPSVNPTYSLINPSLV